MRRDAGAAREALVPTRSLELAIAASREEFSAASRCGITTAVSAEERTCRPMAPGMSLEEFQDLVDRHGEAPESWPERQRENARLLLAASAEARRILAETARLRSGAGGSTIKAPPGLAERIVATALNGAGDAESAPKPDASKPDAAKPAAGKASRPTKR
ncbi:MAG: hypothetical protein JO255_03140 [Alphaproteobacteria bacterium]|nr:hypothetical protein [Alphaproteobacteria bacterium]